MCAKIEDGKIRSTLRILLSEDKPAEDNDVTYNQFTERYSSAPMNWKTPIKPDSLGNYLQVYEYDVKKAICSFALGSSGGPDGFRPQHISALISCNDSDPALLSVITEFPIMLLYSHCPS